MQKKTRKQYSAEFKAKVVKEMLREEKTVGQLAAEYGVHTNMLYRWRDQALAGLPGLFSDQAAQELAQKEAAWQQEREALYAEIGRLTTQVTWLEKNLEHGLSREERRKLVLRHNSVGKGSRSIKKRWHTICRRWDWQQSIQALI